MTLHTRHTIDCDVTPQTTAAYLRIAGDECAFIEAHTAHALPRLLGALAEHGKKPEDVRYLIVTHAHLDHASGASAVLNACPNAMLVAHPRAAKNLIDPSNLVAGAEHVYGKEKVRELYGRIDPIPSERVKILADNEEIELGGAKLRALHTAGHAWHHFAVDDPATSTVFTGDTFGVIYPRVQRAGLFMFPTTSPTGFHAAEAHKSIDRILALGRDAICPTHFGECRDVAGAAKQLHHWIDISDTLVNEGAASGAPMEEVEATIATKLRAAFATEAPKVGLALTEADWAVLKSDIDVNAQGLAVAAAGLREKKN